MPEFRIEVIDCASGIWGARAAWNDLLGESVTQSVFLTCEWICSWAETYAIGEGRTPYILMVWKGNDLVAIAPWVLRHEKIGPFSLNTLAFLGTPEASSDYLDVIVRSGKERDVALCLYGHLFGEARFHWDRMEFVDVPCNSLFFLWFLEFLGAGGKHFEAKVSSFCPSTFLPTTWEEFFRNLSPSLRSTYNREQKLLSKRGKIVHKCHVGNATIEALDEFLGLYQRRWGRRDDRFSSFLKDYAVRTCSFGNVRIDILSVDGRGVAGLFHLRYKNTESMYMMAVDREYEPRVSIGNLAVGVCIGRVIDDGVRTYDFLKGVEPYKFRWARDGARLMDVRIHSRSPGSLLSFGWQVIKSVGKVVLR